MKSKLGVEVLQGDLLLFDGEQTAIILTVGGTIQIVTSHVEIAPRVDGFVNISLDGKL